MCELTIEVGGLEEIEEPHAGNKQKQRLIEKPAPIRSLDHGGTGSSDVPNSAYPRQFADRSSASSRTVVSTSRSPSTVWNTLSCAAGACERLRRHAKLSPVRCAYACENH